MEALKEVEGLISAKFSVIKSLLSLIRLEARLAGLSVFPLVLSICFILVVVMTFWLTLAVLVGYGIYLLNNNVAVALAGIFLLHLVMLIGLAKYLAVNIKNMSFAKTRSYFAENARMNDELNKTIENANSTAGEDSSSATKNPDEA